VHAPWFAVAAEAPDVPPLEARNDLERAKASWTVTLDERFLGLCRVSARGASDLALDGSRTPPGLSWTTEVVTVALAPGANGPVDLPLLSPAPLTVRVRDEDGRPVAGILLRLEGNEGYRARSSPMRTGPDGVAVFAAEDSLVGAGLLDIVDERIGASRTRRVHLGTEPSTIDIVVPSAPDAGTLVVRIVDAQGRPAPYEGSVVVDRVPGGASGEPFEVLFRFALAQEERADPPPREERFPLPPGRYEVALGEGTGLGVAGTFDVASGETTTALVRVPEPGTLLVRAPPVAAPFAPPVEGVEAEPFGTAIVRFTRSQMEERATMFPGGEARFQGVGPVTLLVYLLDAPPFGASAALSPGETTVVEVPRVAFGTLTVRIVDSAGALVPDAVEVKIEGVGVAGEAAHAEIETGSPPLLVNRHNLTQGEQVPGVARFVDVPPGRWRIEAEWQEITVEVRPGESTEATLTLPVDATTFARLRREAAERDAEEVARRAIGEDTPASSLEAEGYLVASVYDEAGRPLAGAEVVIREASGGPWLELGSADPLSAPCVLPTGAYVVRARTPDRVEGPETRAVVRKDESTLVRVSPGPREGAAAVVVRANAPGWKRVPMGASALLVEVEDAEAGARGEAVATSFAPRLADADDGDRVEIGGLPAGTPLRVTLRLRRADEGAARVDRAYAVAAEVTLSPGERRELSLSLLEAACILADADAPGRLVTWRAAASAIGERAMGSPEGQTMLLPSGTHEVAFERTGGGVAGYVVGIHAVTLAPGEALRVDAPASGNVIVRGHYRAPAVVRDLDAPDAVILGPGVAIRVHDGYHFAADRLPAGRYVLRIGGREVRAWDAAPGQVLDLGVVEGR